MHGLVFSAAVFIQEQLRWCIHVSNGLHRTKAFHSLCTKAPKLVVTH